MIVFDLRCGGGHVFEAWFGSGGDYEDQRARGLLACPFCEDVDVEKAVMAPAVPAKGNAGPTDAQRKAMIAAMADAQRRMLKDSTWVGDGFAAQARAMHEGDTPHRTIHGRASLAEAHSLAEDGVPVAPLPLPVVPPRSEN